MWDLRDVLEVGVLVLLEEVTKDDTVKLVCLALVVKKLADCLECDETGFTARVAIYTSAQSRKGDAPAPVRNCQV